ncbi:MAG: efflux RND transporter periplasmic adaptor subunit [Prevotella sp.]|nr:efflux RND transporter periplasmic adaptor subunit [Candidatus Prevotella equi]
MNCKALSGIVMAAMMLVACGEKKTEETAVVDVKYNIQKLEPQTREVNFAFPATLVGEKSVNLYPQVDGRITQRYYNKGDIVQKGQRLISIDETPYRLRVQSDEANVRAAKAALSTAQLHYDSQKKLFEKKIVSEYVMKTAENNVLTAQAQLAQAQAALSNSRTDLGHCTLVAPISGVVTGNMDDIGLLVGPGMQGPILTITDQNQVKAQFSITEDLYSTILRDNNITMSSKGLRNKAGKSISDIYNNIRLRTKDGLLYEEIGKIVTIGGVVDRNTGTVQCEVRFPNGRNMLHAGNSASVIFPFKEDNVLVVPQTACKKLQNKYLIFKVNSNGQAEGVVVNVVPTDDGKEYIITDKSLKAGDEIIADGVSMIEEGQKVK